jgi:hypothetical protein
VLVNFGEIGFVERPRAGLESSHEHAIHDQVGMELESGSRHLSSELIHGIRIIKIKVNSDNFNIKQKSNREVFYFKERV